MESKAGKHKKDHAEIIEAIDANADEQMLMARRTNILPIEQGEDVPPVIKAQRWDHGIKE
jgi:hypothetical protein